MQLEVRHVAVHEDALVAQAAEDRLDRQVPGRPAYELARRHRPGGKVESRKEKEKKCKTKKTERASTDDAY